MFFFSSSSFFSSLSLPRSVVWTSEKRVYTKLQTHHITQAHHQLLGKRNNKQQMDYNFTTKPINCVVHVFFGIRIELRVRGARACMCETAYTQWLYYGLLFCSATPKKQRKKNKTNRRWRRKCENSCVMCSRVCFHRPKSDLSATPPRI